MTHLFLLLFYVLLCVGFVIGSLIDNDNFSDTAKILMTIFSPIVAPLFLGVRLGIIIIAKVEKETNRE